MFAQVACQACGKPFQVPRERLGVAVKCSWCGQSTAAIPLAVEPQPLPPELAPAPARNAGVRLFWWIGYAVTLGLVAGGVFIGMRLLTGGDGLSEFIAPDGSCSVLLPGTPQKLPVPAGEFTGAGTTYIAEPGWGQPLRGEVGWCDIPDANLVRAEDLFALLGERRAREFGATQEEPKVVRVDNYFGREVRLVNGDVVHVERYLFDPKAEHPRLYWVSIGGANFDPESATAAKVTGSLRVKAGG